MPNGQPQLKALLEKLDPYFRLMRLDRPIGTLLLLWPTLWALWIAAEGLPDIKTLIVFVLGVFLMRSAGCVINDIADRGFDGHVARTRNRPLASKEVPVPHAYALFFALIALAALLLLALKPLTVKLAFVAVFLATTYPFMKRYTWLPQVYLGMAFAMGIPMAFAEVRGEIPAEAWLLFIAAILWTTAYDTIYALIDRPYDLKIGVKSTAILFGELDRVITGIIQALFLFVMLLLGLKLGLNWWYYLGLLTAAALFLWQLAIIEERDPEQCFRAFVSNNWVGMAIFFGILAAYLGKL